MPLRCQHYLPDKLWIRLNVFSDVVKCGVIIIATTVLVIASTAATYWIDDDQERH